MEQEDKQYTPEQVYGIIKMRLDGSDYRKQATLIRMLISSIVIIITAIMIGVNKTQTIKIGSNTMTGGGVN